MTNAHKHRYYKQCGIKTRSYNADLRSLEFTFYRLFMKLFKTKSIDVVKACQSFTGSEVPSCVLKRKADKFILRFNCVENTFCNFCSSICNVSVEYFVFSS